MSPASLTVKQKIANGFVIFTAIWSSAIMPVIPSYAKMLDNNDLPTLGSDNIIAEDNTERLVAEYSKTLGTFLSQKKKSKDLSDMAQNYARNKATNEATKEIESWLSKSGNAKLSINLDKKLSVKNSQLDWLIPWYDQPDTLLFTQHSVHRNDGRLQTNNGIGLRRFYEKNTLGINAFIDHDLSHYHTRAGVGVEYWQDYLKVNANTYFALSSWKSTSELNHDFNAKPANGWDIQAEGWLPAYPHLGGSLKYEQYYGDSVALFEKTKRQKNPKAATIGAQWTPFPLLTLNANHKIGSQGKKETQAKIQFTWTLGKSLAHHLDPTKVAEARRLSGNRYDFIERNNNIILDYQKKTLLHLSLPAKIQGETGQAIPLVKSFSSKYPLKQIVWQAPELLLAGGLISSTDQTATVILPTYKTANTAETTQKINRYRLQGTAFDTKGNASPVAETLIEITNVGIISISPNDIKSQGKGLANGHDVNSINVVVRDSHGNVVPNVKVVFILPNALTLATKKINTGTVIQSEFQRELRKKMHAMKVDKPREYTATTNSKGEAQVQFTSQVAGTYEVSAYTNNHPPVKAQVVFKSDIKQAYVRSLTVQKTGAVADGISKNLAKIYVTDTNGNLISGQHVKLTATNAKLVAPELTNEQGEIDLVLTSLKTGLSEITATINGKSETTSVYFINDKLTGISITNISKALAGEEGTITLKLTDKQGNPVSGADGTINAHINQIKTPITIWEINANSGEYEGSLPGQKQGEYKVQADIDGILSSESLFTVLAPSNTKPLNPDGSGLKGQLGVIDKVEINIKPTNNFKSGDEPLITVTLTDAFDNELDGIDFNKISLGNRSGDTLGWYADGHGDYSTYFPLTTLGTIDITASINGIFSPTTEITVGKATGNNSVQNIVVTPNTKTPNAGDKPTIKVELTDKNGHQVKDIKEIEVTIGNDKHTLPVTPNTDGSYTAELPAQQSGDKLINVSVNGKDSNKETLNVQPPAPVTPNSQGQTGQQGVVDKLDITTGSTSGLKSGDTLEVTVTATDDFGNGIKGLDKNNLHLGNLKGDTLNWVDNNDGSYTAQVPLKDLGNIDLTASINGISSQQTDITVGKATGDNNVQNIVVTPNTKNPNAGDKPTIKVELTDKNGHQVKDIKEIEVTIGNDKHTLPVTPNTDGSYTAELPAQQSGDKLINVSVNGKDSHKETLNVQPPAPVSPNSQGQTGQQGVVDKLDITTGSTSGLKSGDTLEVTVTATDTFGNGIKGLDKNNLHLGSLKGDTLNWTDNGDGSYTAQVPLKDLGNIDLTASLNGVSSQKTDITVGKATGDNNVQNIVIKPNTTTPNAGDKPTIKVELTDKNGHQVKDIKEIEVTIGNDKHTLPVTPNTDGSYTAELPAQQSGDKLINVSVNGKDSNKETLNVQPPAPVSPNSQGQKDQKGVVKTLEITTGSTSGLKSGDTLEVTVTATDTFGNGIKGLDKDNLHLGNLKGDTLNWVDNNDGSYTAQVPLKDLGNIDLTASINGISSQKTDITVSNATGDNNVQNIVVTPNTKTPNAGDKPTIKVELTDKNGHQVKDIKEIEVTIGNDKHTLPVTPNTDGSYTAELPAQQSGDKLINVSVNGKDSNKETLNVQPPAPVSPNSQGQKDQKGVVKTLEITTGSTSGLKSGDTLEVTVTATDTFGNGIKGLDKDNLHLGNLKGDTLNWVDNNDGSYTAQVPLKDLGNIDLTASLNGVSSQKTDITVGKATGNNSVQNIVVTPNTKKPNAGDKPTIKVELTDKNGHQVKDIKEIEVTIGNDKHTLPVTPNTDGSYTAELPAQQSGDKLINVSVNGKDSNKETLNVQPPAPVSPNSQGQKDQKGVVKTLEITTGSTSGLKSGDTLEVTVTATDAFGNGIKGLDKDNLNLGNLKGDTLNWTDNGDGSYTAQVPLKDLGNIDLTASLNGVSSQQTDITVGKATGDNNVQNIVIKPNTTTPNAGDKPTIKVELTDKNGHQVKDIKEIEVTIGNDKHTLPVTPNTDGSYTAELPAQQSGDKLINVSVNGKDSNKETLNVQPPAPVTPNSQGQTGQQGVVDKLDITTGSTSGLKSGDTLEVTVTATDTFGNGIKGLDKNNLHLGNLKGDTLNWTDNGDGSYTAQVPLKDLGNIDLTASINGISSQQTEITVGKATGNNSVQNIVVTPNTKTPNAGDKPTIKVELTDKNGHQVKDIKEIEVTIGNDKHTLPVTPNTDGSYTAELPAQQSGDKLINVSVNGKDSNKETLNVQPPAPVSPNSQGQKDQKGVVKTLEITTGSTSGLKSGDTLEVTVTATDAFGNGIKGLDKDNLNLGNLKGDTLNWTDNGDGSYTAQVPLKDLGNIDLTASINGISSQQTDITVGNATGDNNVQNIVVTPNTKNPNAGDKPTIKVELTDKNGHQVKDIKEIEVTIGNDKHTLPVTPNTDGSYTAELPALQAGDHQITATVNGQSSTQDTLEVKKPAPIGSNSSSGTGKHGERGVINNISMKTSDATHLQSGNTLDITVTIIDAFNNPLTAIDPSNIILDGYKASSLKWLDNGDGTYTTPLLLTQIGTNELVTSINGHKSPLLTITVGNTTDINKVANVELEPITPSEAGESQTITVKVTDKYQHPVTAINNVIAVNIDGQSASIILAESRTQEGTYTGTLPAQNAGNYTVKVTANNKTVSKPWTVKTAATITVKEKDGSGAENQRGVVKTVTLASSPINDLKSGQSLQLTVTLKDAFGNTLEGISGTSLQLKHQQPRVSSTIWVDLRNGDYTTILPLTKIGQDTLTVKVNQITTLPLNINVGNATSTTHIHKVDIKNIEKPAAGETSAITLVLTDANNQPITGINNNAVVSINGAEELLKITETVNKGTYRGTLSGQKSGDHKVIVTVGGVKSTESTLTVSAPVPITINHGGKSGSRGVTSRVALTVSPIKDLKSGDTLMLTAILEDAFGNPLTGVDLTQSLTHKQTGKVTWTAQKDGTYTANLVLTQLGLDHVFITVNQRQSPTIIIDVKSQLGINAIHKIDISDITNATAGAQSTFTVALIDAQGNPVNGIQNLDVTLDKQKLPNIVVTQQADGRYSGKLPGQQSGSYDVVISANKQSSVAKTLTVAQPDTVTANSGGTAGQRGVVSDVELKTATASLVSGDNVLLTVTLKDSFNNPLKGVDSANIVLQHNQQAATVTWIDQNNGSYTTTLPLNTLGSDALKATVNSNESLPINIDVASPHHVTQVHRLTLEPISSSSTGSAQTITVKVADTNSHGVTQIADDIKVTLNGKPLNLTLAESKTDKGTYTTTLPAQKAGNYSVKVTVNKQEAKETWVVNTATPLKATNTDGSGIQGNAGVVSSVELATTASSFKSGESVKLTLTLKDAFDNALNGIEVKNITLTHKQTGHVTWVDNKDGTYSADLPLTTLGTDRLVATVNLIKSTSVDLNVEKAIGNSQIHQVDIVDITKPQAGEEAAFTVYLTDTNSHAVMGITEVTVNIAKQQPLTIAVTQQADGRYSGKLPGQQSGSYDVVISANKQSSVAKTLTVAQPDTVTANGGGTAGQRGVVSDVELKTATASLVSGDNVLLTVTLKDSFNNPLKGVDSNNITLMHKQTGNATWTDHNNGQYTTTLPIKVLGSDALTATVNTINSSAVNITVGNTADIKQASKLTLEPISSSSTGSAQTITVKVADTNSHGVTQIADDIKVTLNGKPLNLTLVESKTDKGTYTTTLPAQKAGNYSVKVTVNKQQSQQTWSVSAAATIKATHTDGSGIQGNAGVVSSVELATIASSFKSGESVKLTLTLKDAFDNALNGIEVKNITLTHKQTGHVTWVDNKDGTYSANVDLKILGKDALTATVNKINSQTIDFEVIKTDDISKVKNVEIVLTPTAIAGMDSTLVVALTDLNNHAVTGIKEVTVKIDKTHSSTIAVAPLDNGHYILTLPAKQSGSYDIVVTANNINSASKVLVVSNPSTIVAENSDGSGTQGQRGVVANVQFNTVKSGNLQAGSHLALTVTLKDSFNNPLKGIDSNSIAITHQQSGSVTWKDNGDGTYTADVLLNQLGPDILKVTVNRISQSQTIDVKAPQGKSAVHKVELNAANKTWTVGDSVELQLTLADSHGNGVEKVQTSDIQLEHNHVLATKLTWLEKGAGIYTTIIPLHKQGKNTFVSQVNNKASTVLAVNVSALTDPAQVKAVELKASTNQLTVGSQTELTLTLTDQWNNGVEGITDKDITINDAHIKKNLTGLSWVSKGNGSYTASTVVSIAGIHSLRATVNQVQSHNVLINALPSTSQSHINKVQLTANLSTITAGSKVTLSLKVTDMDNNPVIRLNNNTITLTDGNHKVSAVWDEDSHGLGLYTTNIMLSDVKTHNLMAGIGQFTDTTDVTVNSPVGKDAVKTITISPIANSDAGQPSSLSIGLTDQYKNPVKNVSSSDITVTINRQKQRIIFMEKNVLNKYIAQLPASKTGRYQIMVEANGQSETVHWDVNSPKKIPITSYDKDGLRGSLETISITHSAKTHAVNSGDNITLTVGLKDKFDNTLTGAANSLKLLTNLHSASAWKELSGGRYVQELTMNKLRQQPIQVVADKVLSDKLELNVAPAKGANHVHKTTLETNEGTIEAGKDVLLTLTLTDKVNNSVIDVDTNAIQLTNNGKLTAVTWANPQDGVYTSKLPLDIVGNYQFKATVNNQPSRIETIEVTAPSGQVKVAKAQLASNIASLDAGKNLELTLTLKDQHDNFVIGVNGADITLKDSHTTEVIDNNRVAWRMVSEGIYNASIPLTLIGNHMLTVTVNHQSASTSRITVNSLKGTGNVNQITLTAAQNTISAGEKTTLTLNVLDSFGNAVSDVLPSDINLTNADAQITTLTSWTKVPSTIGTYNASVQLDKVMAHTLIAKVNGQTKTTQIQVNPMKGVKNVAAVSLQAPSTFEVDEKNKLTLTLTDKFGNGVVEVNPSDISLILGSTKHVVTWVEDKNGVYRTELALNKVGNQSISGEVNHLSDTKTTRVNSPTGKDKVASIRLTPSTANVLPGKSVTLNLALKDQYGNGIKNIHSADISLSDSYSTESFTSPNWAENSTQPGFYSATVSLKKTTEHTLTVGVNNVSQAIKITVQPFTDVKQVNSVELLLDQKQISLGGKVNFTVTTKDIYGNDVTIKATDIQLQNANGTIHQPTWQLQGVQHKGELTLSTSGSYVITAKVGGKISSPTNLTVQSAKPVFAPGKSELSANKYDIDEGSNANITVKLVLKDASGNPISGKKPQLTATMGNIDSVMNETALGEYTGAFNNSTLGKSDITLAASSIDYTGSIPPITVVTYGQPEIITIENPHTFSVNDGFPNTGFEGASFQITVPIGQQTDYDWSVDEDWLSINDKGVVTILRKPTPIGGRNAMKPIFKGVPKAHTGYKRTVDYQFTLKKWYSHIGKVKTQNLVNACIPSGRVISQKDMSESHTLHRKAGGGVSNEWGNLLDYHEFDPTGGWVAVYDDSKYQLYNMLDNQASPNLGSQIKDVEHSTICVEDL